jgi:flagellar motor switch protein FliM
MSKAFIPPKNPSADPGQEIVVEALDDVPPGTPRAFTFGAEAFRPMSALPALDRMSERMARRVREVIGGFARAKPRVTVEPVSIRRFENWVAELPEFTSLSVYRFRPLKNGILIAIEPRFVSQLVNSFYGGTRIAGVGRPDEFTPTEEQLLGRLADAIVQTVTEVWSEVIPVHAQIMSRETNTAYAGLVRHEEPVAIARFNVTPFEERPTVIDVLYPVASLRPVEAELSAKVLDDAGASAGEWHDRMAAAAGRVRLSAHSVLARPSMNLSKLLTLAPGDVIPISMPKLAPLLVHGRVIALGTIGEQNGHVALKIEKLSS